MTLSQQQFDQLTAMGIQLWQPKTLTSAEDNLLQQLKQSQLFSDVLLCLGISFEQLSCTQGQLTLDTLTWRFTELNKVQFNDNRLSTPPLVELTKSSALKTSLWQALQSYKS
jgi:DNA polymerase III psi subunit